MLIWLNGTKCISSKSYHNSLQGVHEWLYTVSCQSMQKLLRCLNPNQMFQPAFGIRIKERRPAKFWHRSQLDNHLEAFPPLNWIHPSVPGSEEGAEQAKQALLKAVGKVTDVVSSLGFSWWQGGPPHTQSLKDLDWVSRSAYTSDQTNTVTAIFTELLRFLYIQVNIFLFD